MGQASGGGKDEGGAWPAEQSDPRNPRASFHKRRLVIFCSFSEFFWHVFSRQEVGCLVPDLACHRLRCATFDSPQCSLGGKGFLFS